MLQRQHTEPGHGNSTDPFAEAVGPAEAFQFIVDFVRRQYRVIGFIIAIFVALGVIYVLSAPPRYTATATLLIDSQDAHLFQQQSMFNSTPPVAIDTGTVESQVQIIKSEKIALAVIKSLNLSKDPEFVGPGGGLLSAIFTTVGNLFATPTPPSDFALTRRAVAVFLSRLNVKRDGLTYVITIGFQSTSPDRAAQIANAVAVAYINDQLDAKYQAARRAGTWLQDRLRQLQEQAASAQRAVVAFKSKHKIVEASGRTMNEQQLAELNSELVQAQSKTATARAKVARVEAVLQSNSPKATIDATVADSLKDDVIQKLRTQYLEFSARQDDWAARYGSMHVAVVNLRNQMAEIQKSIRNELQRIAQSFQSDLNISEQHEAGVRKQLDEAVSQSQVNNQSDVELRQLQSQAQSYQALYENFLQHYMESVQQQSSPITDARVISDAVRPLSPSHPRTRLVLALAMVAGLGLGIAVGTWREFADRVFRTSDQVKDLLQTDCIALVPALKESGAAVAKIKRPRFPWPWSSKNRQSSDPGERRIAAVPEVSSAIITSPFSAFSESIRSIKLALDLSPRTGDGGKIVGFTSSVPNEGKSTLACAVARLTAHTGSRTILVDCDLRNSSLSRILSPGCATGLLDVLGGKSTLEQAIWHDPGTTMRFLPVATKARLAHSSEIIGSAQTRDFFDKLRQSYDYIVVDFPPLTPIVDVRASTHLVDSYVYVIEWGRTRIEHVEAALESARGVYEHLLGVALNKVDLASLGRYDGRGIGYYTDERYRRYGYAK